MDLETFLQQRREKKKREKERKKQPLISSFFKRIKIEDENYDADDETGKNVPHLVSPKVVCASSELVVSNSTIDKVNGNFEGSCAQIGGTLHKNSAFTALTPHQEMRLSPVEQSKNFHEVSREEQITPSDLTPKNDTNRNNNVAAEENSVEADADKVLGIVNNAERTEEIEKVTVTESFMQTESVDIDDKEVQTENTTTCKTDRHIQTELQMDFKVLQNDKAMEEKDIQTDDTRVITESKEVQTEAIPLTDYSPDKTPFETPGLKFASVEIQTQLSGNNIEEVDEIQVIRDIHSQPTQTDTLELMNMEPIFSRSILSSPVSNTMKSPERNFDVESNISSCSKSEETTVTASAGLDM